MDEMEVELFQNSELVHGMFCLFGVVLGLGAWVLE